MNAVDVIRKLQATSSRNDKEQILIDAWQAGERNFFHGAMLAYDILISFGVAKAAEIIQDDGDLTATSSYTFNDFLALCEKLRTRELTGHAARDAIHKAAEDCDTAMWNEFYRGVLLKDLRAGVTDTIINKILLKIGDSDKDALKYVVPVFSCQLAKDGVDEANAKKMVGEKLFDVKLDGVRLLTIVDIDSKTVTQYTRNGKINESFPHIRDVFAQMIPDLPCSMVYDGEITGKSFQQLMTQINRKSNKNAGDSKLALFDCLPLADFKSGKCTMPQQDRHTVLTGFLSIFMALASDGQVYVVPKQLINLDTPEGQAAYTEFNREAIAAGYEGIMAKDPLAPYVTKRSSAWLKVKPFIEVSLTIVGYEEGTGKNVGKLGAWLMEGEDDGKFVRVSVGGGFSDKERADFWKKRDHYQGFIGEVRADCFSLEQGETVYSLRFPRWKGFRGTVPGEKL